MLVITCQQTQASKFQPDPERHTITHEVTVAFYTNLSVYQAMMRLAVYSSLYRQYYPGSHFNLRLTHVSELSEIESPVIPDRAGGAADVYGALGVKFVEHLKQTLEEFQEDSE